jgi:hypothetical protein
MRVSAAPFLARLVMAAIGAGALAPVAVHAQVPAPDLPTRLVSDAVANAASPMIVAQPAGPIPTPEHLGPSPRDVRHVWPDGNRPVAARP